MKSIEHIEIRANAQNFQPTTEVVGRGQRAFFNGFNRFGGRSHQPKSGQAVKTAKKRAVLLGAVS